MKFIEWIFEIPRRFWESNTAMQYIVILWLMFLAAAIIACAITGQWGFVLSSLLVLLYTIYWLEEKSE